MIPGETPPRKLGLLHQSIRYSTVLSLVRGAAKELVGVYVANITGVQASQLVMLNCKFWHLGAALQQPTDLLCIQVKLLGQVAPLGDLHHLKRVRYRSTLIITHCFWSHVVTLQCKSLVLLTV